MQKIQTLADWNEVRKQSEEMPILLFKFSKTCLSSLSAVKELRSLDSDIQVYVVVVQSARIVSNTIAQELGVKHESPQVILMKGGRGVWQATHYKIKRGLVEEAIVTYL
ncbi:bacillithiol system redox-active protein YtxJ [Sporosarcina sp. OR05]|uniref:bacillithiol system redox-active protein YtxJ n=1 Tax=Sporosarcina sp. OR05 TaxID=2969819 RepID=UPI003529E4BA